MEIQWPLVIFTLLTGAGGWLLACVALNEFTGKTKKNLFTVALVGLLLVVVGGFASVFHLSHPERIMNALSQPTSGIFVEAALVGIIAVCAIIQLVCMQRGVKGAAKVFAVLSGVFGIVISFMAGESYTVMAARAAWATFLLPLAYLGTAAAMGTGLYWALACPDVENGAKEAALATGIAGVVGAATSVIYCAATGLFAGPTLVFSVLVLVFDVVTAALGFIGYTKPTVAMAWITTACAVVAGLLLRVLMWVAGAGLYGFIS